MIRKLSFVRVLGALGMCFATAAVAHAAGPINVTALPPASCPTSANGTDGVDDTAAFQCAIGLVPANGEGEIYIPAGTYRLSAQLGVFNKSISFRGEGQRISVLLWTGLATDGDGLQLFSTNYNRPHALAVRSLSLLRGGAAGSNAIHVVWGNPEPWYPIDYTNGGGVSTVIEDVHIGPEEPWTTSGPHWHRGIWLENAVWANIHNFNIHGYKASAPSAQSAGIAGIHIGGAGGGGRSLDVSIRDGSILGYIRGVHVTNGSEGLRARNLTIRDAYWGFDLVGMGQGTSISNSHIFARLRGVRLYNSACDMAIANNFIRRDQQDEFFVGIEVNRDDGQPCERLRVIGNAVFAFGGGPARYGITFVNNVAHSVVEGNTTHNMDVGIWLNNSTVTNNIVMANINRTPGTPWINTGVGNSVENNH